MPTKPCRHAAIHAAGLLRNAAAVPQLRDALRSGVPSIQRAAAEALGRIGDAKAIPDLLTLASSQLDRVLEHSVTYALIEINDPVATAASEQQASTSRSKRAALIALDQMDNGDRHADRVVPLLDSSDPVLKDTAWWIAGHHADWGDALARFFESRLASPALTSTERDDLQRKLVQFGDNGSIQSLIAGMVTRAPSKNSAGRRSG